MSDDGSPGHLLFGELRSEHVQPLIRLVLDELAQKRSIWPCDQCVELIGSIARNEAQIKEDHVDRANLGKKGIVRIRNVHVVFPERRHDRDRTPQRILHPLRNTVNDIGRAVVVGCCEICLEAKGPLVGSGNGLPKLRKTSSVDHPFLTVSKASVFRSIHIKSSPEFFASFALTELKSSDLNESFFRIRRLAPKPVAQKDLREYTF